jgi:hypothetical protein
MNVTTSRWRIAVCVLLGLVGATAIWLFWPRPEVVIEINGTPGTNLVGTITAGQAHGTIEEPVPNTITARARSVSYTIENVGEPGTMTVRVLIDGKVSDTITADRDHPVVRGTVESGHVTQNAEQKQAP